MSVALGAFAGVVTVTVIIQVPKGSGGVVLCGIVPPASVTEPLVLVMVPPHCGEAGVSEIVKPAGMVSVKFTPV